MSGCMIHAPYPSAESGYKRIIFALDSYGDNAELHDYKIQLIPGRFVQMPADTNVSEHELQGAVEERTVEGWGYNYYHAYVTQYSAPETEDPTVAKVRRFVPMADAPFFRYNSKLPVVVYIPEDVDLRYNIWSASNELIADVQ